MNLREEHPPRSRLRVVPSVSSRTLQHPSLLPLYLAAGLARHHGGWYNHTVHAITPEEFYYTDPTGSCGTRIPNMLTDFGFYDCFQLNTPPPLMSSFVNPSNRPDPFSLGPHPTRELGSLDWNLNPTRAIIQLSPEEDQAVTHLLKLHYQEVGADDETPTEECTSPPPGTGNIKQVFVRAIAGMINTSVWQPCRQCRASLHARKEAGLSLLSANMHIPQSLEHQ
ncbi:unnamed protein product [Pleuronectes platessa]|uniref:Uncharacterized protein n=1 Tax=Pleuronectes platessa TaxID=8262 RepID=A0A9N7YH23_PLEPL|nr:unnamed protein product [Pleuronectes platessa]